MAVLGVPQIDLKKRTYAEFVEDAQEISRVRVTTDFLTWGRKPMVVTIAEFKEREEGYLSSCFIQKKEEYSYISLEWVSSLVNRVKTLDKISQKDLELFDKVRQAFELLTSYYHSRLSERYLTVYSKIFKEGYLNYTEAAEIMGDIVKPKEDPIQVDRKSKLENCGQDDIDVLLWLYKEGNISKDEFYRKMEALEKQKNGEGKIHSAPSARMNFKREADSDSDNEEYLSPKVGLKGEKAYPRPKGPKSRCSS
ncbi:MAG TPA: hypothetical protein ENH96_02475 [Chlamydiae bacterium]|nr:hypothetical protein [Chlamydiota bacterium]